ncbi:MAG TPA: metalloregulator ArsR/SmtB family transcription factor [Rhodanobacter sp.]
MVGYKTRRRRPVDTSAAVAMHQHADEALAMLKAMASRNRLLLLCELVQGERSVGALTQSLNLAQTTVSQHLSLLRRDGVVAGRREAQTIYYRISDPRAQALMATLFEQFCGND